MVLCASIIRAFLICLVSVQNLWKGTFLQVFAGLSKRGKVVGVFTVVAPGDGSKLIAWGGDSPVGRRKLGFMWVASESRCRRKSLDLNDKQKKCGNDKWKSV